MEASTYYYQALDKITTPGSQGGHLPVLLRPCVLIKGRSHKSFLAQCLVSVGALDKNGNEKV